MHTSHQFANVARLDAGGGHTLARRKPSCTTLPSTLSFSQFTGRAQENYRAPLRFCKHIGSGNAASASPSSPSGAYDDTEDLSGEYCAPAYITVDNKKNANFTVMDIEVQDYPGLVRVIAWVLNGLDLVAQNAILSTSPDGTCHNTLWLSNRSGRKLRDEAAELLADRVRGFLDYCSPRPGEAMQTEFELGPISVSNTEHSQYTVVTVRERRRTPGFLLEVTSVLSGLNVQVAQGVIQGCTDCGDDVPQLLGLKDDGARLFKFWVKGQQSGKKLEAAEVRALLYALGIGLGFSGQRFPLTPPNREVGPVEV